MKLKNKFESQNLSTDTSIRLPLDKEMHNTDCVIVDRNFYENGNKLATLSEVYDTEHDMLIVLPSLIIDFTTQLFNGNDVVVKKIKESFEAMVEEFDFISKVEDIVLTADTLVEWVRFFDGEDIDKLALLNLLKGFMETDYKLAKEVYEKSKEDMKVQ